MFRRLYLVPLLVLGSVFAAQGFFRLQDEDARRLEQAQEALARGDGASAIPLLLAIEADPVTTEAGIEGRLLLIRAHIVAKQPDAALTVAREYLDLLPQGAPARGRARWLLMEAFEAKGEETPALNIYREEAARVLGAEHRNAVAATYVALARELEEPVAPTSPLDAGRPADPTRAAKFYRMALDELDPAGRPAAWILARARNLMAGSGGDWATVVQELEAFLKTEIPWQQRAEALWLSANAHHKSGRAAAAADGVRKLLALENANESPLAAEARFLFGQLHLDMGTAVSPVDAAVASWKEFLSLHPDHKRAAEARQRIAATLFGAGRHEVAAAAYDLVVSDETASADQRAEAAFQVGESWRHLGRFDQAREAWRRFLARFPDHARVPEAQGRILRALVEKAAVARGMKDYAGAVEAMRLFLTEAPLDPNAAQVAVEIGLIWREAQETNRALEAFAAARDRYRSSNPEEAARGGFLVGVVEEEDRRDLDRAVAAYRLVAATFGNTQSAGQARSRLALMESLELVLGTAKLWTPGDAVTVPLTVRNISKFTVRMYRVEAADVFERRGDLERAMETEVALVKADRTFTYEVPEWRPYRRDQLDLPLELESKGPLPEGAWLVTADDGDRRATALVLVSGIRLTVKRSADQLFCWVTDARTGEPVAKASVLVNKSPGLLELTTDENGVAQTGGPWGGFRVLAVRGEGCAPDGEAAQLTLPTDPGLAPRVAFDLDRPLYRPGSEVRFRAVLREPQNGGWATPDQESVPVSLLSPQGLTVHETTKVSEEFGVIHGGFSLPPDGAVGEWILRVWYRGTAFDQAVTVAAFQTPEFQIEVKPTQPVVGPGSSVDCAVSVNYYFGGPVRGANFDWSVFRVPHTPDRARYESFAWYLAAIAAPKPPQVAGAEFVQQGNGTLDADGKGHVVFPASDDGGTHRYIVQVMVRDTAGAFVSGVGQAFSGPTDRFGVVISERKAFRAGETAELRVITADLSQAPVATMGRVRAMLARRAADGTVAYDQLTDAVVDTGVSGEATVRLTLERPGDWRVVFEGQDRAGAPVVAETQVTVTGERPDLVKEAQLRFEKTVYRAGDRARLHLSVPAENRAVLLTFEGNGVLGHRILRPAGRVTVEELDLLAELAPNVTVAMAMPYEDRLLTSQDTVVILRYLSVSVTPEKGVLKPRDKARFQVITEDQSGRPVRASVAFRLSDQALEGLGGTSPTDPRFVFNQDVRPHSVLTASSFDFRAEARSTRIDRDLQELRAEEKTREALELLKRPGAPASRPGGSEAAKMLRDQVALGGGAGGENGRRRQDNKDRGLRELSEATGLSDGPDANFSLSLTPPLMEPGEDPSFVGRITAGTEPGSTLYYAGFAGGDLHLGWMRGAETATPLVMPPVTRTRFLDVAGWWPHLLTDAQGRATVELDLPDNLTVWNATGSGAGEGSAVGRGSASVSVRQDLRVRIERPRFLTHVDQVELSAVVQNGTADPEEVRLDWEIKNPAVGTLNGAVNGTVRVPGFDVVRRDARFDAQSAGEAVISATAAGRRAADAIERSLPVLPYGTPWRFAERRDLTDRTEFRVEVPSAPIAGSSSALVIVESGLDGDILDGLGYLAGYPYGCLEQTLNRFVPAMLVAEARRRAGLPPLVDREAMQEAVSRGLTALMGFQNPDGTFSYWPGGPSDPWVTALGLETLARVQAAGHGVASEVLQRALSGARQLAGTAGLDARAALALALSRAGFRDPLLTSALVRERSRLAVAGLARLVLVLASGDERGSADAVAQELASRLDRRGPDGPCYRGRPADLWLRSDLEATALALLAWQSLDAGPEVTAPLVDAVRRGLRRREGGTKAVALGIEALIGHTLESSAALWSGDVTVEVDGKAVGAGKLSAESGPRLTIPLAGEAFTQGAHRVLVTKRGGGVAACRLVVQQTHGAADVVAEPGVLTVVRRVMAYSDPNQPSEAYAPGYGVVEESVRPRAEPPRTLSQAVDGERVTVELRVTAREDVAHLVIVDPQLATLEVIASGIRGGHDRFERRETAMLFFKNALAKGQELVITYPAYATYRGRFSALPAAAEEMYAPERSGRSGGMALEVVANRSLLTRRDPDVVTADELYARGLAAFEKKDWAVTAEVLGQLAATWRLTDDAHDQVQSRLLVSQLRLGRWAEAVAAFEDLRVRRGGRVNLAMEDRNRLATAYSTLGDGAAARGHYQAVVFHGFEREVQAAAALEEMGRKEAALRRRADIVRSYPPTGPVAAAESLLPAAFLGLPDGSIPESLIPRVPPLRRVLWREALSRMRSVAAWYAGTPLAEEASFRRLELRWSLGEKEEVAQEGKAWLDLHQESLRRDTVAWMIAQAHFDLGRFEEAARWAESLWNDPWPVRVNNARAMGPTPRRFEAGHLLGRIAHVDGRYEDAVTWYGRVKDHVSDAQQSWLFFTGEELEVSPYFTGVPNEPYTVAWTGKNVSSVEVAEYPLDLGVLFAVKKGLPALDAQELAGIRPARKVRVETGLKPHVTGSGEVKVPARGPGAVVLVIRAGALTRTALLVVTDARVTVQRSDGSVRVYVTDGKGGPLADADVRVAMDGRIVHTGKTDARGLADFRDPGGRELTVVAEKGDVVAVGRK